MNEVIREQIFVETQVARLDLKIKKLQLKFWKILCEMLLHVEGFFTGMYKSKFRWFKLTFISVWLTFFLSFIFIIIR